jgi:hypothetical protein
MRSNAVVSQTRVVDWRGSHYRFERLEPNGPPSQPEIEWAVSHQGELIGRMRSPPGESSQDFEIAAFHWLRAFLLPVTLERDAPSGSSPLMVQGPCFRSPSRVVR